MDTRAGEIGDRDTTRFHRSNEWRVHRRSAECSSAPDAWGLDLTTMSILRAILRPGGSSSPLLDGINIGEAELNYHRPRSGRSTYSRFSFDRSPKIAVPTR